jgi:hypothetical protein
MIDELNMGDHADTTPLPCVCPEIKQQGAEEVRARSSVFAKGGLPNLLIEIMIGGVKRSVSC